MSKRTETLSEAVYKYLLDQIMTGHLQPGDRIPEASVAESYGISRTPVRDAMRQLGNEGIIQIYPKRFAQVSEFTDRDIQEVGYMRLTLDEMAVRMAMRFGNFSDFDRLETIAKECLEAFERNDRVKRIKLDAQFHLALASLSGNALLLKFQEEINIRVQ
ncbi:MAG TPA: GntR family transcriptional regulator, partial [Clostridiaceae bacterium]|nr:GntR family transcriptional regulator [Clostridiaceae bacterium]